MTQEISIHQVREDRVAGTQEGADLIVLPGPCTYILSSSSLPSLIVAPLSTYMLGTIVIHCHISLSSSLLGILQMRSATPVSGKNISLSCLGDGEPIDNAALHSQWQAVRWCVMIIVSRFCLAWTLLYCDLSILNECLAVFHNLSLLLLRNTLQAWPILLFQEYTQVSKPCGGRGLHPSKQPACVHHRVTGKICWAWEHERQLLITEIWGDVFTEEKKKKKPEPELLASSLGRLIKCQIS